MADLLILALTVFTFQNNTKITINIHLLEIFALLLGFSYQFTPNCLSLPPPLLGGAISKPLTLPFALAFRTSNIETVVELRVSRCGLASLEKKRAWHVVKVVKLKTKLNKRKL